MNWAEQIMAMWDIHALRKEKPPVSEEDKWKSLFGQYAGNPEALAELTLFYANRRNES